MRGKKFLSSFQQEFLVSAEKKERRPGCSMCQRVLSAGYIQRKGKKENKHFLHPAAETACVCTATHNTNCRHTVPFWASQKDLKV